MKLLMISVCFLFTIYGCVTSNQYGNISDPYTRYYSTEGKYLGYSVEDPYHIRYYNPNSQYKGYSPK